ncbi:MAG: radical SAM protein [Treponema sp.]|jgi:hypothetical protein|nr:radical SAM protein [Treponema sp.]
MPDIILAAINAKWIHPSLALRLLKANLGPLEDRCGIIEFALRQPLCEKTAPILSACPRILGLSVSIWNHLATLELLKNLREAWEDEIVRHDRFQRPVVILGGPEVSYLGQEAEIFQYADYCIRGEGETAFRELCGKILSGDDILVNHEFYTVNTAEIKSAYHLYTDEDLCRKLIYVEASRGCPYGCEFCLSACCASAPSGRVREIPVRELPLEPFLSEMSDLIRRGAKTFKFLDRTFNLNIERARQIMEFFLYYINEHIKQNKKPPVVHFEMVPSRFPPELIDTLARFPPETLRLEIGIQTLNPDVSARIGRPSKPEQELETLRLLAKKTNAIIHADLIAGLPGEDAASFGRGFDALWDALSPNRIFSGRNNAVEIQPGILKLLPGAPIARHIEAFGMDFNPLPPYELIKSAALPAFNLDRIKNFARFWELIVNRGLLDIGPAPVFDRFMALSDSLLAHFGRSWGIAKDELLSTINRGTGDQGLGISERNA